MKNLGALWLQRLLNEFKLKASKFFHSPCRTYLSAHRSLKLLKLCIFWPKIEGLVNNFLKIDGFCRIRANGVPEF